MQEKVIVGMSGGVDSSVAAYLLKKEGYDVIGVTMQIWQDNSTDSCSIEGSCCGLSAVRDAMRVADKIGIPFYVMNFRDEFKKDVIDYFADEYNNGHTPNPCIACNRYIKWEALFNRAMSMGVSYIATGHYAKIKKLENGRYTIANSVTQKKDQTYALYNLTQNQLKHTLLPIGNYEKDKIRTIAKEAGLSIADKPDSQEICFIPDGDYAKFLKEEYNIIPEEGNFIDEFGNILGKHSGIIHYTIGQRKGLGISFGKPMYVKKIKPKTNEIVLGEDSSLYSDTVSAINLNYMAKTKEEIEKEDGEYIAKIRYNHCGDICKLFFDGDKIIAKFKKAQRAPTPGQALVVYSLDGEVVCGGIITDN